MKRSMVALILGIVALGEIAYLMGAHAYALAAVPDETPAPTPAPSVEIISAIPAVEPPRMTPTPRAATPAPTATPAMAPASGYDAGVLRCLARYHHSTVPSRATMVTQIVACEVVQNRTINPGFRDTVRYVLLSGDFGGYRPDCKYYRQSKLIAEYATHSWSLAQTGDRSYRYTPPSGIYLSYSADGRYCKVFDKDWRVVCDTSQFN